MSLNESIVNDAALRWFGALGFALGHGAQNATLHDALLPKLLSGELRTAVNS
jgi:hypothetical protein